jgi:DNA-binding response OmpR family regulator
VGNLRLDCYRFTVSTPERTASLTPREFELMYYLMKHPGQLHSSKKLLERVWGYSDKLGSIDVVRHHIKNIREKIEPDPSAPQYIRTVRRHGYIVGE